jgi:hypothetical protein
MSCTICEPVFQAAFFSVHMLLCVIFPITEDEIEAQGAMF